MDMNSNVLNRRRKGILLMVALLASVVFGVSGMFVLNHFSAAAKQMKQVRAEAVAESYSLAIEKALDNALMATRSLAVMVYQGNGQVPDFKRLANFLIPLYEGVYALSLAPGGVIKYIEPLDKNLVMRDHHLAMGTSAEDLRTYLDAKLPQVKFRGPFKLVQGPIGAIGILPVFLDPQEGVGTFWGFTVVTLVLPDALRAANLDAMTAQGYEFELGAPDAETGEPRIIERSPGFGMGEANCRAVELSSTQWQLCISPGADERLSVSHYFQILLVTLSSLGAGCLVYSLMALCFQRAELQRQALFDPLTALPNRRLLFDRIQQARARAVRQGRPFAVAVIDLDGFKRVNDEQGHASGDAVLITTARRLSGLVRQMDTAARLGGDEFVVLLAEVAGREECEAAFLRIVTALREPIALATGTAQVRASIGVVISEADRDDDGDSLIQRADAAMYLAKQKGKDRVQFADEA